MATEPRPFPYMRKSHEDAMELLLEARDHAAALRTQPPHSLDPIDRLVVNGQTMRLVARLTAVMAWLLERAAARATPGEVDPANAVPLDNPVCLDTSADDDARLPAGLRSLLHRSHRLYVRLGRLDALLRGGPGTGVAEMRN